MYTKGKLVTTCMVKPQYFLCTLTTRHRSSSSSNAFPKGGKQQIRINDSISNLTSGGIRISKYEKVSRDKYLR